MRGIGFDGVPVGENRSVVATNIAGLRGFAGSIAGIYQNYGLIAQDVEQVLPELVATDSDGYKAVDYSKLPLLTIQAMKELRAENDALRVQVAELRHQVENDPLKQRVAELERLVTEMLARQK